MLAAFSILYGGGHLVAWNVDFPTMIERCICRASAISFAGSLPVLWSIHKADEFLPSKDGGTGIYRNMKAYVVCYLVIRLSSICRSLFWPLTQLYILAGRFASLGKPAQATYETVGWITFIPH
jgi:hypothetical protein